jgi:hypothetical protein
VGSELPLTCPDFIASVELWFDGYTLLDDGGHVVVAGLDTFRGPGGPRGEAHEDDLVFGLLAAKDDGLEFFGSHQRPHAVRSVVLERKDPLVGNADLFGSTPRYLDQGRRGDDGGSVRYFSLVNSVIK